MKTFILTFLVGVCGIWVFPQVPNFIWLLAFLSIAIIIFLFFKNKITISILGIACGFFWVMLSAHLQLTHQLPRSIEGKVMPVVGKIVSLPEQKSYATGFLFKTKRKLLKLNWYDPKIKFHPGETWRLWVKLKRPHSFKNPGGYDYEAYLFAKGINATGYIVNKKPGKLIAAASYSQVFNRLREILHDKIQNLFTNQSCMGFISALVMGDRAEVTGDQWQVLRHTGTNHLIAIAGLHVGLVAGFTFFLVGFLWRRVACLVKRIPAQLAAAIFSLVAALFYSLLAGFSLQTERAFIMLLFLFGALIFKRRIMPWHSFCLALFVVLILNPLNVISLSFWMSFVAVAAIIYATFGRIGGNKIWHKYGKIQWIIMLSVIPLSLLIFHESSLISIIANIIAVPWFAFMIMPLCFAGAIALCINQHFGFVFLWLALKNLQALWVVLKFLANLPHVILHLTIPNFWTLIFLFIAIILILSPRRFAAKYLAIIFLLPWLTYKFAAPCQNHVWFTLFDVGQGLASIVRTQHHVLIFDTGPKFGANFDAGSAVILPYLQFYRINKIDMLMVSHGDNDHIGGAESILQNIKVNKSLTSVPKQLGHNAVHCYRGQQWNWDGVKFKVLSPPKGEKYLGNNSSCVLRVTAGSQSILLTGDMQEPVEDRLIKAKDNLAVTILVAPHHGSITSSSPRFVRAAHPKFILYPTGYLNRFHFPNEVVEQRYQKIGAKAYNVAYTGAISFKLNGNKLSPQLYRILYKRLWSD